LNSKEILEIAVRAADSKRAEDIIALDVREVSLLADYFVVMQGGSKRQMDAILEEISTISLFCVWNQRVRFSVRLSEIAPATIVLLLLNLLHNMQHLSDCL